MAVLEEIESWAKSGREGKNILWVHGPAGAGKSAIAQTVAETCTRDDELAASFFFSRTVASRNALKYFFPTIAIQIALSVPEVRHRVDNILKNDPWIAERALGSVDLVASFFQQGSALVPPSRSLVVIDGLDECQGHGDQCRILAQIVCMIKTHHLPLRFLIVSRPEAHLCEAFEEPDLANITQKLSLYGDLKAREDVSAYLQSEFSRIYNSKRHRDIMEFIPRPWPSEDVIDSLVENSGGYFVYASTVVKFIDEESFSPTDRLDEVVNGPNSAVLPSESGPFAELDKLYIQILSSYPTSKLPMLKRIIGYIEFAANGSDLCVAEIEIFLRLPRGQVKLMLRGLRSLVSFQEKEDGRATIYVEHASFGDFLGDKERSKDYYVDFKEWGYIQPFRDAFSLGCNVLRLSLDAGTESALRHPKGLSFAVTCSLLVYVLRMDQCRIYLQIVIRKTCSGKFKPCLDSSMTISVAVR